MGEHFYGKGGEERYDATMKEVRKEHLLPSVTTALNVINKYGLNVWKEDKIFQAVLDFCEKHPCIEPMSLYDRLAVIPEIKGKLKEELNQSAEQGALIHRQVEAFFKHKDDVAIPSTLMDALHKCQSDNHIIPLAVEQTFSKPELGYGGKADLICSFEGRVSIIDWKTKETTGKTSVQLFDEVPMQLAACAVGVDKPDAQLITIVISRDEPGRILEPKTWPHNEKYYQAFRAAHQLWCALKNYNPWTGGKWYE